MDTIKEFRKANVAYKYAVEVEPQITEAVTSLTSSFGGRLAGLHNRIKKKESYDRKINLAISESPDGKAPRIKDVIRYTVIFREDSFYNNYLGATIGLESLGYKMVRVKNYFALDNIPYQGVNTFIESPEGIVFEIQFHTEESYAAKSGESHKLYEKMRDPNTPAEQLEELNRKTIEVFSAVKVPKGAKNIEQLESEPTPLHKLPISSQMMEADIDPEAIESNNLVAGFIKKYAGVCKEYAFGLAKQKVQDLAEQFSMVSSDAYNIFKIENPSNLAIKTALASDPSIPSAVVKPAKTRQLSFEREIV